jgi:hydrogenase maturation protease
VIVIGAGNPWRRDDGAGAAVARALGGVCEPDLARLVERLGAASHAIVVDASASGAPPGTIRRYDAAATPLPAHALRRSTHDLGVADAIELARALGRLPPRVEVYAIEGADFGHGRGLTPAVKRAAASLAAELEGGLRDSTEGVRGAARMDGA